MRIVVPIFNVPVFIHLCDDVNEFLKQRGHETKPDKIVPACTFYEYDKYGDIRFFSVFDRYYMGGYSLLIVHETVHLVNMIFQYAGIKPDLDNDELQAYLTEFIFGKIQKYINA
jgi:hypothetical protein